MIYSSENIVCKLNLRTRDFELKTIIQFMTLASTFYLPREKKTCQDKPPYTF